MFKSSFLICAILCIPALVAARVSNGVYVIRNSVWTDQALDESRGNNVVSGWKANGGGNQRWIFTAGKDSPIIGPIRNEATGNYLNRTGTGPNPYDWTLNNDKDGNTMIQKDLSISLALELTGPNNGDAVKANDWSSSNKAQKWWFVAADTP
ncbi:hypothetical protein B0O80DRAFT_458510 [Mortierella sp. GBAus27b]|nr:hypothetical protein BGX31_011524 [Mortierella sp. GBA43]KAI8350252.1 hypothetical protein B0O80DRAFT_458510 [Mortierella sp. GBAus27b]